MIMQRNAFIIIISLLVITAFLIGIVAYFTDGFVEWNFSIPGGETPLGTLRVKVNGEAYNGAALVDYATIEVLSEKEFNVEIVPGNVSFDFRHNGALVKFPYIEGNFNNAFDVTVENNIISVSGQRSIQKVMQAIYPGEEIADISAIDKDAVYFIVRITGDGQTVELPINGFYAWMSIELDKPEIIF